MFPLRATVPVRGSRAAQSAPQRKPHGCDRRLRRRYRVVRRVRCHSARSRWRACGGVHHGVHDGACRCRRMHHRRALRSARCLFQQRLRARQRVLRLWGRRRAQTRALLQPGAAFHVAALPVRCGQAWFPGRAFRRRVSLRRMPPASGPGAAGAANLPHATCSVWPVNLSMAAGPAGARGGHRRRDHDRGRCGARRCGWMPRHGVRTCVRDGPCCRCVAACVAPVSVPRAWVRLQAGHGTSRTGVRASRPTPPPAQRQRSARKQVRLPRAAASAWRAGCR